MGEGAAACDGQPVRVYMGTPCCQRLEVVGWVCGGYDRRGGWGCVPFLGEGREDKGDRGFYESV